MQGSFFENNKLNGDVKALHKISKKLDAILTDAGFADVDSKLPKEYYYAFSIDKEKSKDVKSYINEFTKASLVNQVFISKTKVLIGLICLGKLFWQMKLMMLMSF
nr:hypothetical protein [Limosilactobacillus reuteri]